MDIIFNKEGNPVAFMGQNFVGFSDNPKPQPEKTHEKADYSFSFKDTEFVNWGDNNDFPDSAEEIVKKTSVLNTGLLFKSRVAIGQGCMPVTIEGYDKNNNEILKPIDNPEIIRYLNDYTFRNYHAGAFRDLYKTGNCFPVFVFNLDYTQILRVELRNARHCRISTDKTKLLVFGDFKNGLPAETEKDWQLYDLLDEADPLYHIQWLKDNNKLKNRNIAFPRIKNFFSNNDYYANPDWITAMENGWIDIAHKIPTFLQKAYANAMHLKWHIKIPYEYWNRKYPKKADISTAERQKLINQDMDKIEESLVGINNADKAIISQFYINESGRSEEKWEIEKLNNKLEVDEKLATSAAANSEILFSLMVNPSVLGAGMPGGPYSGNAGSGSDIREGLTISILLSHIEKQQVLDPVEMMLRFNGHENVQIKYRNTFLSTLDTGKSTESKIE
jgi:hypothetical protein